MPIRPPRVSNPPPGIGVPTTSEPPAPTRNGGAVALVIRPVPGVYFDEVSDLSPGPSPG